MDSRLVLPVNAILDGGYRILRVVGSGGFGITYEAEDMNLGTMVAIKEYYPFDFGERDGTMSVRPKSERHRQTFDWGRSNFLQEARTLARFEHPSIVRVTRVFEAHATAYMVMRFEAGLSFEDWLRSLGRPPTQDELDAILVPLLDALELMHGTNFLHRDIAPDNIIVRGDGTPVLLDFGAARRSVSEMSRSLLTGIIKAGYSPPEQYSSDARLQGPWSDLYALGGTLYRAVTGKAPEEATLRFDDDHMVSATDAAKGEYRRGFLAAIDACLMVRHSGRPQSVAELRSLLFGRISRPRFAELPRVLTPSLPKFSQATVRTVARRWPAVAAMVVVVVGVCAGLAYKPANIAEARQSPATDTAEQLTRQADEQRRKDIADAAAAEARRQAEAAAAAEQKRQEEIRIAALEEKARRSEQQRQQDERRRLAALPSDEDRSLFVKRVQEALKRNQCYSGNITGRADDAQEGVDRFVDNASKSGKAKAPQIKLAKATVGDFESWLKDVESARWEPCAQETAPKVDRRRPVASERAPKAPRVSRVVREPSEPRYARSYEGSGGPGLMLGIGN